MFPHFSSAKMAPVSMKGKGSPKITETELKDSQCMFLEEQPVTSHSPDSSLLSHLREIVREELTKALVLITSELYLEKLGTTRLHWKARWTTLQASSMAMSKT